ncbi:MAG TPA: hypothetical protein VL986_14525 [Terracidiphilus sp.]|nr:hypothetical protein [Terracidiphilus sp.]
MRAGTIILIAMQDSPREAASTLSAPEPSSFAGFLSAIASPDPLSTERSWNREPADDVLTLSYESALKAHSRYRPAAEPSPEPKPVAPVQNAVSTQEHSCGAGARALNQSPNLPGDLKTASITIRMSHSECAQLKQRAAEAGMTVSAYMRSCTFEAETLRGQVKEALAQLRAAATPPDEKPPTKPEQHKRFDWWSRVLPRHTVQPHAQK